MRASKNTVTSLGNSEETIKTTTKHPQNIQIQGMDIPEGVKVVYIQTPEQSSNNGLAAVCSFFLPGLGQIVQARVFTGLLWMFMTMIGYAFMVVPGVIMHLIAVIDAGTYKKKGQTKL